MRILRPAFVRNATLLESEKKRLLWGALPAAIIWCPYRAQKPTRLTAARKVRRYDELM
jgi:hypothetical protein